MIDTPKHPCRICKKIDFDKRDYTKEPCASCPLPAQYIDAINETQFPVMAFLRESRPDHWGIKKAKEKREMTEQKTIEGITITEIDASSLSERAQSALGIDRSDNNKEEPKKNTGKYTIAVDLAKYCAQEGISVDKVTSGSKMPEIACARKRIARAMVTDGIDRKLIRLKLKIGHSTLLNYLKQEEEPENKKPKKPEVVISGKQVIELDFTGREELYQKICNIAEERLRKTENQVMWWLINADFEKLYGDLAGE